MEVISEARDYAYNVKARVVQTFCYQAPEALRDRNSVDTSADIWALGAIISFIANDAEHLFKSSAEVLRWTGLQSPVRAIFSRELQELVLSLLQPVRESRPTAQDIELITQEMQ